MSRGIEGASQNQLLLDAVIYVAAKTDLEQVLEEDIRHDAGIRKRLDAEFGDQKIGEEWAKVAEESVSESNHVLDAYQSIFHFASNLNVIPPKGVSCPFLSFGGSELLASIFSIGTLLSFTKRKLD